MSTLLLRNPPGLILLACFGALGAAFLTQYGLGLLPCELCLFQRVPYYVTVVLMVLALLPMTGARARAGLLALVAFAFVINTGISFFHVGVEQHWWAGLPTCTATAADANSIEALQAALNGPPPPRCDQIPWTVFGISMAGWDVVLSACLAGFAAWASRKMKGARA